MGSSGDYSTSESCKCSAEHACAMDQFCYADGTCHDHAYKGSGNTGECNGDEPNFKDVYGYTCKEWKDDNMLCENAMSEGGYSRLDQEGLIEGCCQTCAEKSAVEVGTTSEGVFGFSINMGNMILVSGICTFALAFGYYCGGKNQGQDYTKLFENIEMQ